MLSQNAWAAGDRNAITLTTITVPGTTTKIPVKAGDVATVLLWVATRWHREVEPLVEPGNWGYAYRPVRGATSGLSNHASGTAIDLNAPKHPLGTEPSQTMSKRQIAAAKRIEADSGGVVRWGGAYTGRKDPMHWEINAGPAAVAAFAARIRKSKTIPTEDLETVMADVASLKFVTSPRNTNAWWLTDGMTKRPVVTGEPELMMQLGLAEMHRADTGETVAVIPDEALDRIPVVATS